MDSSADTPEPPSHDPEQDRLFTGLVRMIEAFAGEPQGRWRVPAEAAEKVLEKLEDRFLAGDLPEDLEAWARKVHRNLLKTGPGRAGERSTGHVHTRIESVEAGKGSQRSGPWIEEWRRELLAVEQELLRGLTENEREAWSQIRGGQRTVRQAAAACGWTPRDFRARLHRIACKARDVIRKRSQLDP